MGADLPTFAVYVFYGLSFFAIGIAIVSRETRFSQLPIARWLWLFALFAFVHSLHEFLALYLILGLGPVPAAVHPLFLLVSFALLLAFGIACCTEVWPGHRKRVLVGGLLLPGVLLAVGTAYGGHGPAPWFLTGQQMRYGIGLPAALLSALGLLAQARSVPVVSQSGARNLFGAGLALLAYAVLAGIVPSGVRISPAGIPIELLRGLSGLAMLHFVMQSLYLFDTERQGQIEERLQRFARTEKLSSLGRLAAGIAHEINNPLASASLNLELLQREVAPLPASDKPLQRLTTIERHLDRASRIARELLRFSREGEAEFSPVDLREVLEGTLDLLGPQRSRIRVAGAAPEETLPLVPGIAWKLEEVFLNVLMNALDASPDDALIDVRLGAEDKRAWVVVEDRGSGIRNEHLGQVLDPFFTTKEVGKGTGLGLSICYGIMQLHGGDIELASDGERGTTVTLWFPLTGEEA